MLTHSHVSSFPLSGLGFLLEENFVGPWEYKQSVCRARSGCQAPAGNAASVPQSACRLRSGCQVSAGEATGATQRVCSARSECNDHAGVVGQTDQQDRSADQVEVPIGRGRWRAGGNGDTPGAEGGLLASLKPMIFQLVKEAVQQAVQELLGSGFSLSGQASSAGSQPQPNSEQPNKPGRKPKGKGTGDHPPVQAHSDQTGGKKGSQGKSSESGQPKLQVEAGAEAPVRQASQNRPSKGRRAQARASQMPMAGSRFVAKLWQRILGFCPKIGASLCLNMADWLKHLMPSKPTKFLKRSSCARLLRPRLHKL